MRLRTSHSQTRPRRLSKPGRGAAPGSGKGRAPPLVGARLVRPRRRAGGRGRSACSCGGGGGRRHTSGHLFPLFPSRPFGEMKRQAATGDFRPWLRRLRPTHCWCEDSEGAPERTKPTGAQTRAARRSPVLPPGGPAQEPGKGLRWGDQTRPPGPHPQGRLRAQNRAAREIPGGAPSASTVCPPGKLRRTPSPSATAGGRGWPWQPER